MTGRSFSDDDTSTGSFVATLSTTTPSARTEGLRLQSLYGPTPLQTDFFTKIERRDVLGGLIHEYHAVAA